jgi:hypothetical protein
MTWSSTPRRARLAIDRMSRRGGGKAEQRRAATARLGQPSRCSFASPRAPSDIFEPDLVVSAVSGPPSAQPGTTFEASLTVCNHGTTPSHGTNVEVVLSSDDSIAPPDFPASRGAARLNGRNRAARRRPRARPPRPRGRLSGR